MAQLAFWPAPRDEDVDRIEVQRASSIAGPYVSVATIYARDPYDNWITHYLDNAGTAGDYYRANYLKAGFSTELSTPEAGQAPYAVTPQMVLDTIQGLPRNYLADKMTQLRIKWAVEWVELQILQRLAVHTATKEPYSRHLFRQIVGNQIGYQIQLRNFPVVGVDNVYYRIRTGANPADQELTGLNIVLEHHNPVTKYNHGVVTMYPTYTSFSGLFSGALGQIIDPYDVSVFVTYRYGYDGAAWPQGVEKLVTEIAAKDMMEIAGEADTAGLSSRSIDGYSESYTASATTTVFSARRMWYEDQAKELVKLHRKPLWG